MKRTYEFENLGCAHCAGKMEEQISHLPGVEAVNLTFATKQLRVWSDDAKALLPQIQDICTSIEPDVKVVVRENTVRAQKEAKKAKENSEDNREFWELGAGIILFIAGKGEFLQSESALPYGGFGWGADAGAGEGGVSEGRVFYCGLYGSQAVL